MLPRTTQQHIHSCSLLTISCFLERLHSKNQNTLLSTTQQHIHHITTHTSHSNVYLILKFKTALFFNFLLLYPISNNTIFTNTPKQFICNSSQLFFFGLINHIGFISSHYLLTALTHTRTRTHTQTHTHTHTHTHTQTNLQYNVNNCILEVVHYLCSSRWGICICANHESAKNSYLSFPPNTSQIHLCTNIIVQNEYDCMHCATMLKISAETNSNFYFRIFEIKTNEYLIILFFNNVLKLTDYKRNIIIIDCKST